MDIGILVLVEMSEAIDHRLRLLGGGGIVEPDQRLSVHLFLEKGEIPLDGMRVERTRRRDEGRHRFRLQLMRQNTEIERRSDVALDWACRKLRLFEKVECFGGSRRCTARQNRVHTWGSERRP
jgi:hypothetical protein